MIGLTKDKTQEREAMISCATRASSEPSRCHRLRLAECRGRSIFSTTSESSQYYDMIDGSGWESWDIIPKQLDHHRSHAPVW